MADKRSQRGGTVSDQEVNRLFEENKRIAKWCMYRVYGLHLDHPAVKRLGGPNAAEQEALIALWRAARAYQPRKGDFAPYAFRYVCNYLYHISTLQWTHHVRVPLCALQSKNANVADVFKLRCVGFHAAEEKASREPAPDEVAATNEEKEHIKDKVSDLFSELPPRQGQIIRSRLFDERPFADIGRDYGVTKQRAQQMFADAVDAAGDVLDPPLQKKCLTPQCDGKPRNRGLCLSCWGCINHQVRYGKVTWEELVEKGLAYLPMRSKS